MSEEKKIRPQVLRRMKTADYYPGQYSISNADFLHFNATVEYVVDFKKEDEEPSLRVVYKIDGDHINMAYFRDIGEGLAWLKDKIERAIIANTLALAEGRNVNIEDT